MNVRLICNVCSFHFSAVCVRLVLPVDRFMLLKVRHTHSKLNSVHYLFLSLFFSYTSVLSIDIGECDAMCRLPEPTWIARTP